MSCANPVRDGSDPRGRIGRAGLAVGGPGARGWHRQVEPRGRHRTRKPSPAASVAPGAAAMLGTGLERGGAKLPGRRHRRARADPEPAHRARHHPGRPGRSGSSVRRAGERSVRRAASFDTPPATALLRVLAGHGRRIRTTRHLPRRGLAEHRAAMLAASSAPFPLFCDDDVWLEPGVVGRLHEAIVELGAGWWARLSGPVLPARPPTGRARTVRAVVGPSGARADRAPGCRRGNAGPA